MDLEKSKNHIIKIIGDGYVYLKSPYVTEALRKLYFQLNQTKDLHEKWKFLKSRENKKCREREGEII